MIGMFEMNFARTGQALASAQRAYGHAANYSRERRAERAAESADPLIRSRARRPGNGRIKGCVL
jgi:alkylation response protein AidB-like acyl-CoA dehydrogenase